MCPECRVIAPLVEWQETENPCDECDPHSAMLCPRCSHSFDIVWDDKKEFEVLYPDETEKG